jgi:hypothetical protein
MGEEHTIVKPPEIYPGKHYDRSRPWIFLAGSIDMGAAEDWQDELANEFKSKKCVWFNPRRSDWDSSWKQGLNEKQFYEQVQWELDHLEQCDIIALYFANGSQSPISLLELGLHAKDDKVVVYCDDFYRKGNVDIVCQRYNIPVFTDKETWKYEIERRINNW